MMPLDADRLPLMTHLEKSVKDKTSCHVGGSSLRRQSGNQPSNTADGIASPRLGRSSSVGMGSGESTGSGRGPAWHHVPRALHTHGQRITTRIPSWLHLTALGEYSSKRPSTE